MANMNKTQKPAGGFIQVGGGGKATSPQPARQPQGATKSAGSSPPPTGKKPCGCGKW